MKKISPIQFKSKGQKVADLHQAFDALGFQIAQKEIDQQYFGTSTRTALQQFQKTYGLQMDGVLAKATASRLNVELEKVGSFSTTYETAVKKNLGSIGTKLTQQTNALTDVVGAVGTQTVTLGKVDQEIIAQTSVLKSINTLAGQQKSVLNAVKASQDKTLAQATQQTTVLGKQAAELANQTKALDQQTKFLGDQWTELTGQSKVLEKQLIELANQMKALGQQTQSLRGIDGKLGEQATVLKNQWTELANQTKVLGKHATELGKQTAEMTKQTATLGQQIGELKGLKEGQGVQTSWLEKQSAEMVKQTGWLQKQTEQLGQLGKAISPTSALALHAQGVEVAALHERLNKLGYAVPSYETEKQVFGIGTQNALLKFQARYDLSRTGKVDASSYVAMVQAVVAQESGQTRMEGRIVLDSGMPAENLTVRLYQKGLGGQKTRLQEVQTDAQGYYTIPYDDGGKAPNLAIVVVGTDGKEVDFAATKFQAESYERMNGVVPRKVLPQKGEFQRLAGDLVKELGDLKKLATVKENADIQDITDLRARTGWDARVIALGAMAGKLSADPDVKLSHEVVYGLLRAGLPSDKLQLANVEGEVVERALKTVRDAGIVDLTDQQIGQTTKQFSAFANQVRLKVPAPGSSSTYEDFLAGSGLSQANHNKFASVFFKHRGAPEDLWKGARDVGLSEAQVQTLQVQGKLAFLSGNSEKMTTRLQKTMRVKDPVELVEKNFFRADPWIDEIDALVGIPASHRDALTASDKTKLEAVIPSAYVGDNIEARRELWAEDMARKVRLSYPTQVVTQMIETDAQDAFKLEPVRNDTVKLLKNSAAKGYRLGETPVDAFYRDNPDVMNGIPGNRRGAAKQSMKLVHRVYQITPSNEAMTTMLELGLTSAYDVVGISKDQFLKRYSAKFPSNDQACLVYRKSQQVSSVTYNLFTIAKKLEGDAPVYGVSGRAETRETVKNELIKQFPTMESLFGSMDFCECEHCGSVFSPAAYLVDLLQFVDVESAEWANFLAHWKMTHSEEYTTKYLRPYDALIQRRPDLPYISLTCENTHTALPYIDLVNEILEYYVANDKLEKEAAGDTGEATTAELLAEPQHVIREAYDKLREGSGSRYPLNLPFDLWLETVRQFCDYFEAPLAQILESFRPSDELFVPAQSFDRSSIFLESLRLSPSEAALFTNPDPLATWHELYGYPSADVATTEATDKETDLRVDLNSAKALSRRLGVTYKEMAEIIQTGFVNPKLTQLAFLYKLDVSIYDVRFYLDHKGLLNQDVTTLSIEDQKRRLEVEAFVESLTILADTFNVPREELEADLEAIPFDEILVLADPDAGCNFDKTLVQYANGHKAQYSDFLRINLFVRLWRKLGWSLEETDRALNMFVPKNTPFEEAHFDKQPLKTALIYLAHLKALDEKTRAGKDSLLKLLTLWADLSTTGKHSLYAQLFLTTSVRKSDPTFDHPLGRYLTQPGVFIKAHMLTLQGSLGLTADEIEQIFLDNEMTTDSAELTLFNVSTLYRYGLLAKALELSVRELIILKQLSGLNPFAPLYSDPLETLEQDHPFSQALCFVGAVGEVKESGLKIGDLDYLLRHRFDKTGKYRLDHDVTLALLKTLAEGVRAIQQVEHVIPEDPSTFSDEMLKQKLVLVLSADVAEQFLAMLNGTVEYTATKNGVAPANQLDPQVFVNTTVIRQVSYNEPRQEQKLTLIGVLFDDQKNQLKVLHGPALNAGQKAIFAELLDTAQAQASAFFDTHLLEQTATVPVSGFLRLTDFDLLFKPLPVGLTSIQEQEHKGQQRSTLVNAFLPFLQQQLIEQFIIETVAAHVDADSVLVKRLLTDERLLQGNDTKALVRSFETTGVQGISVMFFDSDDLTGGAQASTPIVHNVDTTLKDSHDSDGNTLNPANSARFEGNLEVPKAGAYRFYIELDRQNADAELNFDHLSEHLFLAGTAASDQDVLGDQPDEYLELQPGILYPFSLTLRKLNGGQARMLVQGEALAKDGLSQLSLYPTSTMKYGYHGLLLLTKVLQLIESLGFSEREIQYIQAHAANFGGVLFSEIPTQLVGDSAAEKAKVASNFEQFRRLAGYGGLKRDFAGGTEDLIEIFEANETGDLSKVYPLIAQLTRREEMVVQSCAEALAAAPNFSSEQPLERLWDALKIIERFGVSVPSLLEWTKIVSSSVTATERFALARNLKETIKSRFDQEVWQRVAQPIFDKLRQRQRDALVAYVMHQQKFARLEKLYEYFLIDPGMEPVVQTSRIRLAIGSVQLFIQRCLLNLETQVHPSVIKTKQWEWMKRYRVWEANRKIFLFPENWLEPEFRDDKTHLFAELEGALLEGDVSKDLVEDAFLNYLKKLEELARLDIVGMHLEDNADPARRTLHVIGRTFNEPRKYFYRRYAHQMWTPWEPVSAEITGDHIAPVIWRDRLYVFWVTFMDKPDPNASLPSSVSSKSATEVDLGELNAGLKASTKTKSLDAKLHWSYYSDGDWSTVNSSEFVALKRFTRSGVKSFSIFPMNLDTKDISIHVSKEALGNSNEERGIYVHLNFNGDTNQAFSNQAFYLAGGNSQPEGKRSEVSPINPFSSSIENATKYKGVGNGPLTVTFSRNISTVNGKAPTESSKEPHRLLGSTRPHSLLPCNNELVSLGVPPEAYENADNPAAVKAVLDRSLGEITTLIKPIFYQEDQSNTFFVEPNVIETTVEKWEKWVTPPPAREPDWYLPEWLRDIELIPEWAWKEPIPRGPGWETPDGIIPNELINPDPRLDWFINPKTVFLFEGVVIGPKGQAGLQVFSTESAASVAQAGQNIKVNHASGLSRGMTLVSTSVTGKEEAGLFQGNGGLNIIGGAGLNSSLQQNLQNGFSGSAGNYLLAIGEFKPFR
jgi:peptidoglycan hydrolase-like protein with peptidoglycan-binding domain